jgi:hypothetical protein
MKPRATYFLSLLLIASALWPTDGSIKPRPQFQQQGSAYSSAAISVQVFSLAGHTQRGHDDHGPQIRQASDAAIYGSVVPAGDVMLSLIGKVKHLTSSELPYRVELATSNVLFKVLFRVIIAPNAP